MRLPAIVTSAGCWIATAATCIHSIWRWVRRHGEQLEPRLSRLSMPCGSQILATEPLSRDMALSLLPNNFCVEDCNYLLDYFRLTADNRLLYGGGVVYGARDPADIDALILLKLLKTFPQLKRVRIDYR
ncbi:hypothetical protein SPRA44_490037 [Serratia proteamaculans]|nr:hypothetical protein SPRA44_490037 [Serratia proteamaculans]